MRYRKIRPLAVALTMIFIVIIVSFGFLRSRPFYGENYQHENHHKHSH